MNRWVPYLRAPNKCELNCMPKGERFYYRHRRKVIDGTRCDEDATDVCVDGHCLVIPLTYSAANSWNSLWMLQRFGSFGDSLVFYSWISMNLARRSVDGVGKCVKRAKNERFCNGKVKWLDFQIENCTISSVQSILRSNLKIFVSLTWKWTGI